MSDLPRQESTTFQLPTNKEIAAQCERFEAAWQTALEGGPVPAAETYLRAVAELNRSTLSAELQKIANFYQPQLREKAGRPAPGIETVDPSTDPSPGVPVATVDFLPGQKSDSDEIESVARNTDPSPGVPVATVDFLPGQKSDPHETVDPEPAAAAGQLGETMDFPKASPEAQGLTTDSAAAAALLGTDQDFSLNVEAQGRGAAPQPMVVGYEILSELGRGGMGVVYKARQLGLNRLVALKMVLAGAHASAHQLGRFHTEAEAVAHLLHPNIVQIYEVGNHEGLPYFSLEYVDGGSLADKIAGKPQKVKDAAQMIEILALAMAYAHQHGIIHRDLKPANVLMTTDGLPKITDFGLAKRLEDDSSQTKSGTLMGTPNYMAPEQAHGRVSEMGPLTDVYSLGVILYEMLTGRTPFMGASMLETLALVRSQEPVPPSRLQPTLPADIETICLKCLQKEPGKRYRDADSLARDLHHFLGGEPIEARPVGNLERLWRWCKRNPRIAAMTATIFVLLVAGVIGSTISAVTIARERNQKERERQAAEEARNVANEERQAAEDARNVANEQVVLALDTVKTLIHQAQDKLENEPRTQPLKKALLQTAAEGLEKINQRAKGNTSNEVAMSFSAVHMKMGLVYKQLGDTEAAFKHVQESHAINQEQAKLQPDSDRAKSNLAASYTVLADMIQEMRRDLPASLEYSEKALKLREELYAHPHDQQSDAKHKTVKQGLAETYMRVGTVPLRMGDPARARDYFKKALQLRQELAASYPKDNDVIQDLARTYYAVSEMCQRLHETDSGKQYYAECLKLLEPLFQAKPNDLKQKQELARWCGIFGEKAENSGAYQDALRHYQRLVDLDRELVEIDPKNVDRQRNLGTAYYQLATICLHLKDTVGADKSFHECLKIRQALAEAEPKNLRRQMELIGVLPHCGEHLKAAEAAEKLRQSKPKDQEFLIAIGCCYACCSAVPAAGQLRQHYIDKSLEALNQCITLGFKDLSFFETDPDLEPVRKEPGFRKLLERLKAH